jgi:hypothetical protein
MSRAMRAIQPSQAGTIALTPHGASEVSTPGDYAIGWVKNESFWRSMYAIFKYKTLAITGWTCASSSLFQERHAHMTDSHTASRYPRHP